MDQEVLYEPESRFFHVACSSKGQVIVRGGLTLEIYYPILVRCVSSFPHSRNSLGCEIATRSTVPYKSDLTPPWGLSQLIYAHHKNHELHQLGKQQVKFNGVQEGRPHGIYSLCITHRYSVN